MFSIFVQQTAIEDHRILATERLPKHPIFKTTGTTRTVKTSFKGSIPDPYPYPTPRVRIVANRRVQPAMRICLSDVSLNRTVPLGYSTGRWRTAYVRMRV